MTVIESKINNLSNFDGDILKIEINMEYYLEIYIISISSKYDEIFFKKIML